MRHFNDIYSSFDGNAIALYADENSNKLLVDIDLQHYPVKDLIGIFSEMNSTIKAYNKLNHRNRKKDNSHLFKHAMHLIRLLITGTDILNGKGIITKRTGDNKLLMDIRNGIYSFDEIFKMTEEFQLKFHEAAKTTNLQNRPDIAVVERLMTDIYRGILTG